MSDDIDDAKGRPEYFTQPDSRFAKSRVMDDARLAAFVRAEASLLLSQYLARKAYARDRDHGVPAGETQ
jgi:hypothetical protein